MAGIYREAAAELMEMGRLDVRDEQVAALVLARFGPDLVERVSARERPDGTWEMTFDQRQEVTPCP